MKYWTKPWNPITGCTPCSPACANCYAARDHMKRHKAYLAGKLQNMPCYAAPFNEVRFLPERLEQPLHWRKPQRIFVGNMGDLFHADVMETGALDQIFAVMARCPQHTFMLCTKRPDNQHKYITSEADLEHMAWLADMSLGEAQLKEHAPAWPLPNVWLGATIWDQQSADRAVPILLSTPAAKRFVSIEPMLGPVDLTRVCTPSGVTWDTLADHADAEGPALDWIICGGETGPGARPMHPDWPRKLRDDCQAAGVPFFFKQWGEWKFFGAPNGIEEAHGSGIPDVAWPDGTICWGKAQDHGGRGQLLSRRHFGCEGRSADRDRVLDGRTWEEVPRA